LLWHPYSRFTIVSGRSEEQAQYSRILKNWQREVRGKKSFYRTRILPLMYGWKVSPWSGRTYSGCFKRMKFESERKKKRRRENYTLQIFVIRTVHKILLGRPNEIK
jgi:hypothetical protein